MIVFEYGKAVASCDGCGAILCQCDTFEDALATVKESDWKTTKLGDLWLNLCPECQEIY